MYVEKIYCKECGMVVSGDNPVTVCPECGSPLTIDYDFDRIRRDLDREALDNRGRSLQRYRELLPLEEEPITLGEGGTPVVQSSSLVDEGEISLYFKLEYSNPTGSFKDRGVAMTVSKAKEWGVKKVADDSSGNAGAALAGYSAKAGFDCTIYVPEKASGEKIKQVESYGAELLTVPGPRENTAKKIREDTMDEDTYYASHNLSPYFPEGMKTVAYEIAEYFDWKPPEHVVLPVGGGALLVGIYRGFRDLILLNWIDQLPRLYGVQSESCDPVVRAFEGSRKEVRPVEVKPTVAEGIHIGKPERGREILSAIRDSGGRALSVKEESIVKAHRDLSRREGIYSEPTSAAPVAGLKKLDELGLLESGEEVLIPITGFGLKDIRAGKRS